MSRKNDQSLTFVQAKAVMARLIAGYTPTGKIARYEILIAPIDQIRWLSAQRADIKVYGANGDDTASIAGIGKALRIYGNGKADYLKIFHGLRKALDPGYPYMQWYGGFSFDPLKQGGAWKGFGSWNFVIPRFELAREGKRMIFCCNLSGKVDIPGVLQQLQDLKPVKEPALPDFNVYNRRDLPDAVLWSRCVNTVLKALARGEVLKTVLARQTDFDLVSSVDPWLMLQNLCNVTPYSYHFAFEFNGRVFLGASPECLYRRAGHWLFTEALAGTKPAGVPVGGLLSSKKDLSEHQIVVEAIIKELKPLCLNVKAANGAPLIKKLSNGIHLHTPIQAQLKEGVRDEDILKALHPTPALGGQPRFKAMSLIRKLEPFTRGWYGAPVGFVGLDRAEFVVGIRSGLVYKKKLSVFAGAGIVKGSDPSDEWDEIENKISNFFRIIKT